MSRCFPACWRPCAERRAAKPKAAKAAKSHEAAEQPNPKHSKTNPREPDPGFVKRHEGFLQDLKAKQGKVGILFVGDLITDGSRGGKGKEIFDKNYGGLDPLNIGIGGDRTQHVLWRFDRGEVEGISPKVAVLMIGTNNLGGNSNEEIAAGVTKIVHELNTKLPKTKVLLRGSPARRQGERSQPRPHQADQRTTRQARRRRQEREVP